MACLLVALAECVAAAIQGVFGSGPKALNYTCPKAWIAPDVLGEGSADILTVAGLDGVFGVLSDTTERAVWCSEAESPLSTRHRS